MSFLVDADDICGSFEATQILGISSARIWQLVRDDPDFPRPFKKISAASLWRGSELEAWKVRRVVGKRGRKTNAVRAQAKVEAARVEEEAKPRRHLGR